MFINSSVAAYFYLNELEQTQAVQKIIPIYILYLNRGNVKEKEIVKIVKMMVSFREICSNYMRVPLFGQGVYRLFLKVIQSLRIGTSFAQ